MTWIFMCGLQTVLAMRVATIARRFVALLQCIVSHDGRDSKAVVGEYACAPLRLGFSMRVEVAPAAHCFFIAPERKRKEFPFCDQALETLDRYESIDFLQ